MASPPGQFLEKNQSKLAISGQPGLKQFSGTLLGHKNSRTEETTGITANIYALQIALTCKHCMFIIGVTQTIDIRRCTNHAANQCTEDDNICKQLV